MSFSPKIPDAKNSRYMVLKYVSSPQTKEGKRDSESSHASHENVVDIEKELHVHFVHVLCLNLLQPGTDLSQNVALCLIMRLGLYDRTSTNLLGGHNALIFVSSDYYSGFQTGIPRGTLEIVIQAVLWCTRRFDSAICSFPLTNVNDSLILDQLQWLSNR